MNEILKQAQSCFFAAMMKGWAAGVKGIVVPNMPGYKEIVYEKDGFRIVDCYGVSKSGMSEGTTRIWFGDNPVWIMHYWGFYKKEAIPLLKRALMKNYGEDILIGGRGPRVYQEEVSVIYTNRVESGSSFAKFCGREEIIGSPVIFGWHDYCGMALI